MATRHPYAVRKVTSGRVAGEKWIVVLNPGGRRVSVHAYIGREGAQAALVAAAAEALGVKA